MGQSLNKLEKYEEKKIKEIYDKHLGKATDPTLADFYRAVFETVGEINKTLGSTQFRITADTNRLREVYGHHVKSKKIQLTRKEFEELLQEVIEETGITGGGATEPLIYFFGVPILAFFIKQRLIPSAIPNDFFIPGITSLTAFLLAKFNKI